MIKMQEGYILSFASFIQECTTNENTKITHAIYMSEDSVLNEYIRYPYKKDSLKLFFSMTKSFTSLAVGIALDLGLLHLEIISPDSFQTNFLRYRIKTWTR